MSNEMLTEDIYVRAELPKLVAPFLHRPDYTSQIWYKFECSSATFFVEELVLPLKDRSPYLAS